MTTNCLREQSELRGAHSKRVACSRCALPRIKQTLRKEKEKIRKPYEEALDKKKKKKAAALSYQIKASVIPTATQQQAAAPVAEGLNWAVSAGSEESRGASSSNY